jgi:translation elongation factor EF-1alpha
MYEQLTLLYILGIKHIIFAFNKIDLYSFSESKNRFMKLRKLIMILMREIGLKKTDKYFVPVSSYTGENVRKTSGLKWYESYLKNLNINTCSGSLLDCILKSSKIKVSDNLNTKALLTKTYLPSNHAPVYTGISVDKIKKNTQYFLQPGNKKVSLKNLQSCHNEKEIISQGENIAFTINEDLKEENIIPTALTIQESKGFNKFVCKIIVKNIPKIKTNTEFILNFDTKCKLKKVFSILDKDEQNILNEHTSIVGQDQTAIVLIETNQDIFLEPFDKKKNSGKTGRITLQNNLNEIVGFGIVKGIKE